MRLTRVDTGDRCRDRPAAIPPASGAVARLRRRHRLGAAGGRPADPRASTACSSPPCPSAPASPRRRRSSSSSAWALSGPVGRRSTPLELARIAQRAENEYVGVQCGLMDQFASACGVAGHALLLDCRSARVAGRAPARRPGRSSSSTAACSHAHGDNEYNERRAACERVVAAIARDDPAVTLLRDVDMAMLDALPRAARPGRLRRAPATSSRRTTASWRRWRPWRRTTTPPWAS